MKGVIVLALKGLVVEKFGEDAWKTVLEKAGIDREPLILPTTNIEDETVMKVIQSLCKHAGLSLHEAGMAFGDYWVNNYAQGIYGQYYRKYKTAKEFLLAMDDVHVSMTQNMKDARPPRFKYDWTDEHTLIMHYISKRGLIDLLVGLVHGVATFYKEKVLVKKLDDNRLEITFP